MDVDTSRHTISIIKACKLVGVSRRTIYNWMKSGKLQYVRTAGGSVRIYVDTLFRRADGGAFGSTGMSEAPAKVAEVPAPVPAQTCAVTHNEGNQAWQELGK